MTTMPPDPTDPTPGDTPPGGGAGSSGETPPSGGATSSRETPPSGGPPRKLARSSTDRVLGGVAGGIGRHLGVDPLLVRIAFVLLLFAGAAGLVAYLALLFLVPAEDGSRVLGGGRTANVAGVVAVAVLVLVVIAPPLIPIAAVTVFGLALWRLATGRRVLVGEPAQIVLRIAIAFGIGAGSIVAFTAVFAGAALGGGIPLAVLAVVAGAGLIVAAFAGGPRWMVLPAFALVVPLAIVTAGDVHLDGGVGERHYRPATAAQVKPGYELGAGKLTVDLRGVTLPAGRTDLKVRLGAGQAVVRVPENACVSSDVRVGAGHAGVLDGDQGGIDVAYAEDAARGTAGGPELHLTGDVGLGALEVRRGDDPVYAARYRHGARTALVRAEVACP